MTDPVTIGDCLEVMPTLAPASVDSIVTDPPYGLGFMGKGWDRGGVPGVSFWTAALRVAKPGAHLLAFGGTRTWHRLACAIEDAGWELRDTILWLYGSGFPKSLDVSKAIDKAAGHMRGAAGPAIDTPNRAMGTHYARTDKGPPITAAAAAAWQGWGTALKPAWEPILLARKSIEGTVAANVLAHGTGGLNIDGCRIEGPGWSKQDGNSGAGFKTGKFMGTAGDGEPTQAGGLRESERGRWPANLCLDEEAGAILDEQSGDRPSPAGTARRRWGTLRTMGDANYRPCHDSGATRESVNGFGDCGGASRFFYCAKASRADREEGLRDGGVGALRDGGRSPAVANHHPTVKPTALMRWLCRLVTPPGGLVLDPFTGSGSTGKAAVLEGFCFLGIEREADYAAIARKRIAWAQAFAIEKAQKREPLLAAAGL